MEGLYGKVNYFIRGLSLAILPKINFGLRCIILLKLRDQQSDVKYKNEIFLDSW